MASPWQTVRVFISSTFRDMHAERDHLVKVVFPRLRQWCEQRRLHLVDIDLRWGVTREQTDNGAAIDICLQEIDGSRPFFVCLLGGRYGWVPDRLPPEEMVQFRGLQAATHRSITHLEIIHAVEQPFSRRDASPQSPPQEVCWHAYFYLRDDHCVPSPEAVPAAQRKSHAETFFEQERADDLRDLKAWIRDRFQPSGRCHEYSGTWDPTAENPEDALERPEDRLVGRLTELEALGERVYADLERAIADRFAEHIERLQAADRPVEERLLEDERALHDAFIENRTQIHVPRVAVEQALTQYLLDDRRQPLVVSGPPGSGKSAVLAHWVRRGIEAGQLVAPGDSVFAQGPPASDAPLVLARFIGASPRSTNLARQLGNLCEELRRRYDLHEEVEVEEPADGGTQKVRRIRPMEVPADPKDVLARWPQFLAAAAQRAKVAIILDAINQLDRATDAWQSFWLPRELPPGVKLIVSVLDHGPRSLADVPTPADVSPDWLSILRRIRFPEVPILALTPAEQTQIIRDLPNVFCKTLEARFVERLLANPATANPLFLIVALDELRVYGSFDRLEERIGQFPHLSSDPGGDPMEAALNAIFGQVLARLEDETNPQAPGLVRTVFRWLAAARDGLSEAELGGLLARHMADVPRERRDGLFQVVLRQVRPYLMRKEAQQGTVLIDFYHRSFWKAVRARFLPDEAANEHYAAQGELADYFDDQLWWHEMPAPGIQPEQPAAGARPANLRKVAELPWQLLELARVAKCDGPTEHRESTCHRLAELFQTLEFLEARNAAGLVFDLPGDFSQAIAALPADDHPCRLLKLLDEALRRDIRFIHRHRADYPQGLFQCLWNACWWYDSSEAGRHYERSALNSAHPHSQTDAGLSDLMERWRSEKESAAPYFCWLRSRRPPPISLGSGQLSVIGIHDAVVNSVSFLTLRGRVCLASASRDKTVRVWDVLRSSELLRFDGYADRVRSLSVSSSQRWLASTSDDGALRVSDLADGTEVQRLESPGQLVRRVHFLDDERLLAAHCGDRVLVWGWQGPPSEPRLSLPADGHALAFCSRTRRLAFEEAPGSILIVDSDSGGEVLRLTDCPGIACAAFSPDGRLLVTGGLEDSTVRVWDIARSQETLTLRGHQRYVTDVQFSPNGELIASASSDDTIRLWRMDTGEELSCHRGHEDIVQCIAFSPDGSQLASGSWDGTVRLWDCTARFRARVFAEYDDPPLNVSFSRTGDRLVAGANSGRCRLLDVSSGVVLRIFGEAAGDFHHDSHSRHEAVITPSGDRVLCYEPCGPVVVFHAETGSELRRYEGRANTSRDGLHVVQVSDCAVTVWNTETDEQVCQLQQIENGSSWFTDGDPLFHFSGDGRWVLAISNLSASACSALRIWHTATGEFVGVVRFINRLLTPGALAVSHDAMRVAITTQDAIEIWDTSSGNLLQRIAGAFGSSSSSMNRLSFSRDAALLLASDGSSATRIWNVDTGECVEAIDGMIEENELTDGSQISLLQCISRHGTDTVLRNRCTKSVVGRMPLRLFDTVCHPHGRVWAGSSKHYTALFQVECYPSLADEMSAWSSAGAPLGTEDAEHDTAAPFDVTVVTERMVVAD